MRARAAAKTAKVTSAVRTKDVPAPEVKRKVAATKSSATLRQVAARKTLQAKSNVGAAIAPAGADHAAVAHRIHALLHTMHQIERYEERLCSMQDAIKRSGRLSAALLRDLQGVLEEIPSDDYLHDLEAVRDLIAA